MVDTDGIEESLEGMARVAITAGARLGEQLSQAIAQRARELEARTAMEARELRDRFEAERAAAVAEVRQVHGAEFWNQNDPQHIGQTFATATAWREFEPEARTAEDRMKIELRERYGIDTDALGGDATRVQEWVAQLEAERLDRLAQEERRKEQTDHRDASQLLAEADRLDRSADEIEARAYESDPEDRQGMDSQIDALRDEAEELRAQAAEAEQTGPADARSVEADRLDRTADEVEARAYESTPDDRHGAGSQVDALHGRADELRGEDAQTYDSAGRRAARAAELEGKQIDQETVATRMRADVSQGRPASEAVSAGKVAKARKTRIGTGAGRTQQLGR